MNIKHWARIGDTFIILRKMNPSAAFLCLCIIAVYSTAEKTSKAKRDVSGLFPFPRVGKSDTSWSSQYLEPREIKRQGLIPFPRVGRNKDDNAGKKRDTMENGGAMWFGPRLGRLQKRNYFNDNENWALVKVADLSLPSDQQDLTSRFNKDNSEDFDQTKDYRT